MGVVHLARHPRHGFVALKTTADTPTPSALAALRAEIDFLTAIDHPGVVRVLDHGTEGHTPWMAMALLQGLPLSHHLRVREASNPLLGAIPVQDSHWISRLTSASLSTALGETIEPGQSAALTVDPDRRGSPHAPALMDPSSAPDTRQILGWMMQVSRTLAAIHGEGVVHADIKPGNILITDDQRAVILDFGLARFAGTRMAFGTLKQAGLLAGSLPYISPEQLQGEPLDARADLYALGCVLVEVVKGRPPFEGTTEAIIEQHIHRAPPKLTDAVFGVPDGLETIVQSLLAKDRRARPGHARAVINALRASGIDDPVARSMPDARPYLYKPSLVGRGPLLDTLQQRFESASSGRGSAVFLGGESGVGKTRLVAELLKDVRRRGGVEVLIGHTNPESQRPLGLFVPILREIVDRCLHEGPKATAWVFGDRDAATLAALAPFIRELPGAQDAEPLPDLPHTMARLRLLMSLARVLTRYASTRTLVLVLDDLHWADDLSLEGLQILLENLREAPWLVVGTFRSEEIAPELQDILDDLPDAVLDVERLDNDAIEQIIAQMLGQTPGTALLEEAESRSNGNPFFVAEYLQMVVESGALRMDDTGRWTTAGRGLANKLGRLPEPDALQRLIESRLDNLPPHCRQICEVTAVLGRRVSMDALGQVAGRRAMRLQHALGALFQRQILERDQANQVRFVHDKLREVTLANIDGAALRDLHQRAAQVYEALEASGRAIDHGALGNHWLGAGQPHKARARFIKAGRQAVDGWALLDARQHYRAALALFDPRNPHTIELRHEFIKPVLIGLHEFSEIEREARLILDATARSPELVVDHCKATLHLAFALIRQHQTSGIRELLARSLKVADALENDALRVMALRIQCTLELITSDDARQDGTLEGASNHLPRCFDDALLLYEATGDLPGQVSLLIDIGIFNATRQDYARSIDYFQRVIELSQEAGLVTQETTAQMNMGIARIWAGQYQQGLAPLKRAEALFAEMGNRFNTVKVLCRQGEIHMATGHFASAVDVFTRATDLYRPRDDKEPRKISFKSSSLAQRALALARLGHMADASEAIEETLVFALRGPRKGIEDTLAAKARIALMLGDLALFEQTLAQAEGVHTHLKAVFLRLLASRRLEQGRPREALAAAQEALEALTHDAKVLGEAHAARAEEARALTALGRLEDAGALLDGALEALAQTPNIHREIQARALLYRAELWMARGELDIAAQDLDAALDLYEAMAHTTGCARALCAHAKLAVAEHAPVQPWLAHLRDVVRPLSLHPDSPLLADIRALEAAQSAG